MKPTREAGHQAGFAWDAERRFPLLFGGLLFASLLVHAAAFIVFQVTYPQRVTIPPPAPQVTVLSPALPEHQALLAWIAAEDPALSAATRRATPKGLLDVTYHPSFATVRTWPRPVAQSSEPVALPAGESGWPFVQTATASAAAVPERPIPMPSQVTISGPLAGRTLKGSLALKTRSTEPLQPVEFMLGVGEGGEVKFVFMRRSSGNERADQDAEQELRSLSFTAGGSQVTWGFATIGWGDEAYISASPVPGRNP